MGATSHVLQFSTVASQWAKSEITQLFHFIRQPVFRAQCIEDPHWAIRAVFLSLLTIILVAPFAYLINSLQELLEIEELRPSIISGATAFVSAVLLAPLLEESLFRGGLRSPVWALAGAPVVTIAFLIDSEQRVFIFAFFLTIVFVLTLSNWNLFFGVSQRQLEKLQTEKFRLIFWANCFYFACAHLSSFQFSGMQVALFWLVIAPQLVFAVVFSYLRLRNGIKSAVLSHMTINLVGFAAYTAQATS